MNAALLAAYRRTIYRVHLPEGDVDLRVGELSPTLDAALEARGVTRWAWLTAVNPRSEVLSDAENRRRLHDLAAALANESLTHLPGVAIDPDGAWPDEASFFVLEPDAERLRALADRFEQNAYLAGERGEAARLVLLVGDPVL